MKYTESFLDTDEDEEFINSYVLKSRILIRLDKKEESIETLTKVISISPEDSELYYKRAKNGLFYTDINKVLFDILMALDLDPSKVKYQEFYDMVLSIPFLILYWLSLRVRILKALVAISTRNPENITSDILNEIVFDSRSSHITDFSPDEKSKKFLERKELSRYIKLEVEEILKRGIVKIEKGILYQEKTLLKVFIDELETVKNYGIVQYFTANLLNMYKENDWKEISKNFLISKIYTTKGGAFISGIDDTANSYINILIDNNFLVKSKTNHYIIDKKKFEEEFNIKWIYNNNSFQKDAIEIDN